MSDQPPADSADPLRPNPSMTDWDRGYEDGFRGRANRFDPSANDDPQYDARMVIMQLNAAGTPVPYAAGYLCGNHDGQTEDPWAARKKREARNAMRKQSV